MSRILGRIICVVTLSGLAAWGCGYATVSDPDENRYEIFESEQSFDDVVQSLKNLVAAQKYLSWVTRSTDCMERPSDRPDRWLFACGTRGPWCTKCNEANPYDWYAKWGIVERLDKGSKIMMTRASTYIYQRFRSNAEILEKAGVKADLKGYEKIR